MYILTILLILVLVLAILLAVIPIKVAFTFSSQEHPDLNIKMTWLNSFLRGNINKTSNGNELEVYLAEKKILSRSLKGGKKKRSLSDYINLAKSAEPHHLKFYASYGFEDPASTGMTCGAMDIASEALDFEVFEHTPDFDTTDDYFNANGSAEINAVTSFFKYLRLKRQNTPMTAVHGSK